MSIGERESIDVIATDGTRALAKREADQITAHRALFKAMYRYMQQLRHKLQTLTDTYNALCNTRRTEFTQASNRRARTRDRRDKIFYLPRKTFETRVEFLRVFPERDMLNIDWATRVLSDRNGGTVLFRSLYSYQKESSSGVGRAPINVSASHSDCTFIVISRALFDCEC